MSSKLSMTTKFLLVAGSVLIVYDYLCRAANIYFFWESGVIGWFLLLLGFIILLLNRIDVKSSQKKGAVVEKGLVLLFIFILAIKIIVFGVFMASDAFEVSSNYLKTNEKVRNEIGPVSGVVLFSEGEINTASNSEGEHGEGVLNLVAKGHDRYKQLSSPFTKNA